MMEVLNFDRLLTQFSDFCLHFAIARDRLCKLFLFFLTFSWGWFLSWHYITLRGFNQNVWNIFSWPQFIDSLFDSFFDISFWHQCVSHLILYSKLYIPSTINRNTQVNLVLLLFFGPIGLSRQYWKCLLLC